MGSVPFHGQLLTFHGLVGDALESPLRFEENAGHITVGSNEFPDLGPKVVKFNLTASSGLDTIVDSQQIVHGLERLSGGIAFSSLNIPNVETWGDDWTIGLKIFELALDGAPWGAVMFSDDLCRAYEAEHVGVQHVVEIEDMVTEPVYRCIEVGNRRNYWMTFLFQRNAECRLSLYERGTGVLLAEKVWTGADLPASYLHFGIAGFRSTRVPYPQAFGMTDLVFDTDNALYPILDYDPPSEPERKSNVITKCTSASQVLRGPLSIQGFKWISQPGSLIVAGDRLVTNIGIEHYAEAGHLGCVERFKTPIALREGEELTFSVLGHGAVFFFTT